MYVLMFVFIFLLGTIIGSFLNVVIYRFNSGKSMVNSRSICLSCNSTLRWYELIPVFSFLIQSGRCRICASTISHQYPLVEFGTGAIFVLLVRHFLPLLDLSQSLFIILVTLFAFIFSLLIVISVYDLRHKIIPDKLVYAYALASLLSVFVNHTGTGPFFMKAPFMSLIIGPLLALPFALLWLVSKGKWMGLGDAKLILGIGWMLGPLAGLAAVMLSFWIGTLVSVGILLFSYKKIHMKTEIPFAPFLILSTMLVFFFNLDVFSFANLFKF